MQLSCREVLELENLLIALLHDLPVLFFQTKVIPADKDEKDEVKAGVISNQAAELHEETGSLERNMEGAATNEEKDGFGLSGDQLSNSSYSSSSSVTVTSISSSSEAKPEPAATEAKGSSTVEASGLQPQSGDQDSATVGSEAAGRLVQAEVHASLENGEKEPPSSSPSSEEKEEDSEERAKEDENDEDGSRKEDYSEGDLIDISAYSGLGEEDSGGSQLDDEDDEDEEEAYQPESSCSEIPGLPEEEEPPPPSRKIRFSTQPIRVSFFFFFFLCSHSAH